jgi:hypothetical protein
MNYKIMASYDRPVVLNLFYAATHFWNEKLATHQDCPNYRQLTNYIFLVCEIYVPKAKVWIHTRSKICRHTRFKKYGSSLLNYSVRRLLGGRGN